ncbi:hypothetical protein GCM10027411_13040 [Microbacterium aureliae]
MNVRAEKSEKVPSCEKCSCHHRGSDVVLTERSTPTASTDIATSNERCDSGRSLQRAAGADCRAGAGTAVIAAGAAPGAVLRVVEVILPTVGA